MSTLTLVVVITIFALVFDFLNGANDRANAIATVTATKALSPKAALILASVFDFIPVLFVPMMVAETIGKGIIAPGSMTLTIILSGLIGANTWVFLCTYLGVPVSVSHSLVGGIMGAGVAAGATINWGILTNKVFLAIIFGPLLGLVAGATLFIFVCWALFLVGKVFPLKRAKVDKVFQRLQIGSAAFMSFAHGMNDTQNAMGVITAALLAGGCITTFSVPLWVKLSCGGMMALGTLLFGWRVMKTLGWKISKLEPKHGCVAETAAAAVVVIHSAFGIPLSTTHVIGSSVMGGTLLQNVKRLKKMAAAEMVVAWIITIPCATLVAGTSYYIVNLFM